MPMGGDGGMASVPPSPRPTPSHPPVPPSPRPPPRHSSPRLPMSVASNNDFEEDLVKAAWSSYAGAGPYKLFAWNEALYNRTNNEAFYHRTGCITSTDMCTDSTGKERMPSVEQLKLYFQHAKLAKFGKTLSKKRTADDDEPPSAKFAAIPKHCKAICEVVRLTIPFDKGYEYLEAQIDKAQARSDRASKTGKDEKADKYEACLEQLTAFQNSLEELAAQFQEFNEAIFEGDYDAFHEHLGNYGVPEAILMDKDELYT